MNEGEEDKRKAGRWVRWFAYYVAFSNAADAGSRHDVFGLVITTIVMFFVLVRWHPMFPYDNNEKQEK
jgi:hypothetical protein